MSDFKTRLIQERDDLQEKTEKLVSFIHGNMFPSLPIKHQNLLKQQHSHMHGYLTTLNERLENL